MSNLIVEIAQDNDTEGYRFNKDVLESGFDKPGGLYRSCLKGYGKCTGKIYFDENGKTKTVGWVFEKLEQYSDSKKKFKCVTWVTLLEEMPKTVVTKRFKEI